MVKILDLLSDDKKSIPPLTETELSLIKKLFPSFGFQPPSKQNKKTRSLQKDDNIQNISYQNMNNIKEYENNEDGCVIQIFTWRKLIIKFLIICLFLSPYISKIMNFTFLKNYTMPLTIINSIILLCFLIIVDKKF